MSSVGFAGEPSGLDIVPLVVGENPGTPIGGNVSQELLAPACATCARGIERRHWWKNVTLYGGALVGLAWFALALFAFGMLGIGLAGLALGIVGPVVWDLADPPRFSVFPNRGMIAYEFRAREPAQAFARANGGRVA